MQCCLIIIIISHLFYVNRNGEPTAESRQHSTSADKLLNVTSPLTPFGASSTPTATSLPLPGASLVPPTGSTKLTRKFSLSPKVIRRKIIARLQQELDKTGSSGSEAEDSLAAVITRFRQNKVHFKSIYI